MREININVYIILGDIVKSAVVQGENGNDMEVKTNEITLEIVKALIDAVNEIQETGV